MTADSPKLLAWITQLLGLGLVIMGTGLVYVLIVIWPAVTATGPGAAHRVHLFGVVTLELVPDAALLLLVVVSSALGGFVHAATSFATYVGNRALTLSWVWWYLLRIFIGGALAVIFYLAVRGGFLAAQADSGDVNPYGMAALAGLVGLFSKQATDKLEEVFTTLFRVQDRKGDALRKDKVALPVPRLVAVEPASVPIRATAVLRLLGEGFAEESTARVTRAGGRGDVPAEQRVVSDTAMELTIDERALDEGGTLELVVVNPAPGGGTSNAIVIQVEDVESGTFPALLGRLRRRRR
ncbi:IPT/TIG domain-containing protein [Actinoplanes sp. NPDC049681]|uniref:IPT/TIG domain-containing protein n=1 Tax=Actinoplanes sp. NPDC049681 TaxID=3363905 RepID=UPI0037B1DEDE